MKKALAYLQKLQIAAGGIFLSIFLGSVVIRWDAAMQAWPQSGPKMYPCMPLSGQLLWEQGQWSMNSVILPSLPSAIC